MKTPKSRRTLVGLLFLGAVFGLLLTSAKQRSLVSFAQDPPEELALPIAEYSALEAGTLQEKAKRHGRNKRYDRQSGEQITEAPYPVERIWSSHWARNVPAIPVSQSDVILIGAVANSHAYLSDDKTGVYSEFDINVEEVLKVVGSITLNSQAISAERFGGAVRFPSGVIQKYRTSGQGMPKQGRRYLLFMKRTDQSDDFSILTGYELRGEKVVPLDGSSQQGNESLAFDSYKGADVSSFLRSVRDAIAQAAVISQSRRP
jgi:hypothetical protein